MACNIVLAIGHMGFVTKVWYKWWCIWASLLDANGHHTSYLTCCRAVSRNTLGCTACYITFKILCIIICLILFLYQCSAVPQVVAQNCTTHETMHHHLYHTFPWLVWPSSFRFCGLCNVANCAASTYQKVWYKWWCMFHVSSHPVCQLGSQMKAYCLSTWFTVPWRLMRKTFCSLAWCN